MPMQTIELPNDLNAFMDEQLRLGRHATPDDIIKAALERYAQDVATELELAAMLDNADFESATLRAFMMQVRYSRTVLLTPLTTELGDRIENLIGPISEIAINLDVKIQGDSEL